MENIHFQVTPAAGIINPEHAVEISIQHQDFHTLEEFVDGIPQSWWSEDMRDKEVILLINIRRSCSLETVTHPVQVCHRFCPSPVQTNSRSDSKKRQQSSRHAATSEVSNGADSRSNSNKDEQRSSIRHDVASEMINVDDSRSISKKDEHKSSSRRDVASEKTKNKEVKCYKDYTPRTFTNLSINSTSQQICAQAVQGISPRPGGGQYDPLYDNLEPSSDTVKKSDHGLKRGTTDESDFRFKFYGSNKPLDLDDNSKKIGGGVLEPPDSSEKEEYGDTKQFPRKHSPENSPEYTGEFTRVHHWFYVLMEIQGMNSSTYIACQETFHLGPSLLQY